MEKHRVENLVVEIDKVFKGVTCEIRLDPILDGRELFEFTWGIHHVQVPEYLSDNDKVSYIDVIKFVCNEFINLTFA
jgi:hypothetical protein